MDEFCDLVRIISRISLQPLESKSEWLTRIKKWVQPTGPVTIDHENEIYFESNCGKLTQLRFRYRLTAMVGFIPFKDVMNLIRSTEKIISIARELELNIPYNSEEVIDQIKNETSV